MKLEELLNKYSLNADKLSDLEKEESQNNSKKDDPTKWTPQAGKTVIRLLPSNEDIDMTKAGPRWYRKIMVHYIDSKGFICPKMLNQACPCCDFTWNVMWPPVKDLPKDKRGNWGIFLPKERYISKVLVRKYSPDINGKQPFLEIEEDEIKSEAKHPQVRLFDYAKTYYEEIKAIVESGPKENGGYGDVLSLTDGTDLFLSKTPPPPKKKGEAQDFTAMQKSIKITPSSMSTPVFNKTCVSHIKNSDLFVDTFMKMMEESPTINSRYEILSKDEINKLLSDYQSKMITGAEVEKIPGTGANSESIPSTSEDDFNHGSNSEFAALANKFSISND
jgi:hypothetical protein